MDKIIYSFYKRGYINDSNDKIVILGLQRIIYLFEDVLTVLFVSWIMGNIVVGIVFEAVYIPLRVYAGGFHAANEKLCKYISWGSSMVCLLIIFLIPVNDFIMHFLQMVSWIAILLLSPVQSKNRPLSYKEQKIFRIRSIAIASFEMVVYWLLYMAGALQEAKSVFVAMLLVVAGLAFKQF